MIRKLLALILCLAMVVLMAGAVVLYNNLKDSYTVPEAAVSATETAEAETVPVENTAADATATPQNSLADFSVQDVSGNTVRLSDHLGKPIVLNFWATWCPPCKSELPSFDKLSAEYADRVDFLMIDLTDGARETVVGVKDFVAENGYSFPVYFDTFGEGASAYGIRSIPLSVFLDADGNIVAQHLGAMDEDTLRAYIESLLG